MKILTWNMGAGFAFSGTKHEAAWKWLNAQDADVALIQEAAPALVEDALKPWASAIFRDKYQNWGSAVLVRDGEYAQWEPTEDQPWLRLVGGAVAVARPVDGDGLWFGSVHSDSSSFQATNKKYPTVYADLPDAQGILRCNENHIWEIEVIAHELAPVLEGQSFMVGGDLNSSLLFDKGPGGQEERLFSNLASLGFVDTRPRHAEAEVQTYFKKGRKPYQLDHVYADATTETRVTSWSVLTEVAADLGLSDHAPVLIEIGPASS